MTRAEYEACQARDEQGFRVAIEALTRRSLEAGLAKVDYKALVADEWRRGNIDDIIDRQVDQAIGEVRDELSWFKLWSTLASQQKAQELATTAAERVYRSDADEEGASRAWRRASARRSASASSSPPSIRRGRRRSACRPSSAAATAPPSPASSPTAPGKRIRRRPGQGRRPGLDRPGAGRRQRRHRRHGRAGGAPAARQHGLAHRPARRRLDPGPPGVGGGRRHRPGADRQGHLGLPPRRAAHHRAPR